MYDVITIAINEKLQQTAVLLFFPLKKRPT